MNFYLLLILFLLLASYAFDTLVELLNLNSLRVGLPKAAKDIYTNKKYTKSQKYLRESTKFGLLSSTISTALTVVILLSPAFSAFDSFARRYTETEIGLGLFFFFTVLVLTTLYSLPFSIYKTFVIEEKYGFNKTTPQTFVTDLVKSFLLTVIIGLPIAAIVISFFQFFGGNSWIYIWIFLSLFQLFMLFIAPVVIMPLFNKFTPLPKGNLRSEIEAYAKSQNFKLEGIYTMDGSKRSSKSNAFFTGFGKFKRIALFDTLIEKQTTQELVAVLAHEIGHYKKGHILKQLVMGLSFTGFTLFIFSRFIGNETLLQALGFEIPSIYASLIAIGLLYSPVSEVFGMVTNFFSRKFEFEADAYAVNTYNNPKALETALKQLSSDNLTNLTPHPLKVFIDYSHPPVLERLKAIRG